MASQLKRLFLFFFKYCFSVVRGAGRRQTHVLQSFYAGTQRVELCLVKHRRARPRDPMLQKESFRAINSKRGRRSDKSVCIPKLSALRHRCLRFLLLRRKRMRLLWLVQHGNFFLIGCKSSKSTNHKGIHVWRKEKKSTKATVRLAKVPVEPNPRSLYPYPLVCSPVLSLLDPSLSSSPLLLLLLHVPSSPPRGNFAESPLSRRLFSSCCSVTITTFSLLDRQQLARPSPPVAL